MKNRHNLRLYLCNRSRFLGLLFKSLIIIVFLWFRTILSHFFDFSMKYEAVTIKDIAKALGLSTSTVSRALRDSYEISPETKKIVIEYAQQINYRPNPIALSLKEKRSRSIGIIVCEIANSFFHKPSTASSLLLMIKDITLSLHKATSRTKEKY